MMNGKYIFSKLLSVLYFIWRIHGYDELPMDIERARVYHGHHKKELLFDFIFRTWIFFLVSLITIL